MSSLGIEFPKEQARVRGVLELYKELRGQPMIMVEPAIAMIEQLLTRAEQVAISGDIVQMIQVYEELKSVE